MKDGKKRLNRRTIEHSKIDKRFMSTQSKDARIV